MNDEHNDKISTLEGKLKDFQLIYVIYSILSKFIEEEFKQLSYKIHEELYQRMVSLFEGLN